MNNTNSEDEAFVKNVVVKEEVETSNIDEAIDESTTTVKHEVDEHSSAFNLGHAENGKHTESEVFIKNVAVKEEVESSDVDEDCAAVDESITVVKHEVDDYSSENFEIVKVENTVLDSKEEYEKDKCRICSKRFDRWSRLKEHMYTHTNERPYKCKLCTKGFNDKSTLNQHVKSHSGVKYECEVCGQKFSRCDMLKKHMTLKKHGHNNRTLTDKKFRHVCTFCGRGCSSRSNLIRHARTHTRERPYECEKCPMKFMIHGSLVEHQKRHSIKNYKCDYCDKSFNKSDVLKDHLRTHTGEKPYRCEVCYHCFARKQALIYHMRTHTGEKPHRCDVCGKTFTQKSQLTVHLRSHTGERPYECDKCEVKFTVHSSLVEHRKRHAGIKNFKCEYCDKSFINGSVLKNHLRTHTGEKPYRCGICDKRFAYKTGLTVHVSRHNAKEKPAPVHKIEIVLVPNSQEDFLQEV